MINSFLISLQNSGTQPVNPSSVVGDVLWPDPVEVKTYTGAASDVLRTLFDAKTGLDKFLLAIQYLWVVEESVLADRITSDDPRVTYTQEQLEGQFIDQVDWGQSVSYVLQELDTAAPLTFLEGDLLSVYRSSLSPMDHLAALICYYGLRDD